MKNKKTVILKVNGIHCNGCASKIKNGISLLKIDDITDINVETGDVKVAFDADLGGVSDIKSKITGLGYQIESFEIE